MKSEDFKKEIHSYIDDIYNEFEEFQNALTDMYNVFYNVCKRNGINVYYAFGSLLGIIRDDGMIPWDADIDVFIPINKVEDLLKVLERDLPPDYYVVSNFTNKNYYLCEMRICKRGFDSSIFHVDVFYLIGVPSDPKKLKKFDDRIIKMFYRRALRYDLVEKGDTLRGKLIYYLKMIRKLLIRIEPNWVFNRKCNRMLFKYNFSDSELCAVWDRTAKVFPISTIEPAQIYKKGNFECLIFNNPEVFLTHRYSNYDEYLPISDRFDEFYSGYKRIQKK